MADSAQTKNNMISDTEKMAAFISKHRRWEAELETLRQILNGCDVSETVKWGSPAYQAAGATIISLVAFKNHYALWFHQGVFMADKARCLVSGQEEVTKGLRQWRFTDEDSIDPGLVRQYVDEAIANQRAGKTIKSEPKKESNGQALPKELEAVLAANEELRKAFFGLTAARQKEYAKHVAGAKLEKTRLSRVQKAIPTILSGVGLNDKYRRG